MSALDAICTAITYVETLHVDPKTGVFNQMECVREWKRMARELKIPIVEDPELVKRRHADEMKKVEADFAGEL